MAMGNLRSSEVAFDPLIHPNTYPVCCYMCYTHDTEPIIQQIIAYQGWQTMHLWKIGTLKGRPSPGFPFARKCWNQGDNGWKSNHLKFTQHSPGFSQSSAPWCCENRGPNDRSIFFFVFFFQPSVGHGSGEAADPFFFWATKRINVGKTWAFMC